MSTPSFLQAPSKNILEIFLSTHINVKGIDQKTEGGLFSPLPGEWVPLFGKGSIEGFPRLPFPLPSPIFSTKALASKTLWTGSRRGIKNRLRIGRGTLGDTSE